MSEDIDSVEEKTSTKVFLPTLIFCMFCAGPLAVLIGLFLYPMAAEFKVEVGIMGQINTFSSVVAVVFALIMGFLSARFKHKSLLIIGLLFFGISSVGCFLAADFSWMLLAYSVSGLGVAMINPMTSALIGEYLPLKKRANAIAWTVGAGALSYVISPIVFDLLAVYGGWRFSLLSFIIPLLFLSLLLASVGIPSMSRSHRTPLDGGNYLSSFKQMLSNRSALACLASDALRSASFGAILFYGAAFFMQRLGESQGVASIVLLGAALSYTVGSLAGGRLVNRVGRKPSTVVTILLAGIFTIFLVYSHSFWISLTLNYAAAWFFGMATAAAISLTLEQVPKYRGTMMSVDTAFVNLGYALGAAFGGLMLIWLGYEGLGTALGLLGIIASVIFYTLAKDPTKP
jgi:predicted MFS family arabinose efflux permease